MIIPLLRHYQFFPSLCRGMVCAKWAKIVHLRNSQVRSSYRFILLSVPSPRNGYWGHVLSYTLDSFTQSMQMATHFLEGATCRASVFGLNHQWMALAHAGTGWRPPFSIALSHLLVSAQQRRDLLAPCEMACFLVGWFSFLIPKICHDPSHWNITKGWLVGIDFPPWGFWLSVIVKGVAQLSQECEVRQIAFTFHPCSLYSCLLLRMGL